MTQTETGKQDGDDAARRNRAIAIGGAGGAALQAFARAGFQDPMLVLRWAEIVGAEVARFAQPLRLAGGPSGVVLTLKIEHAASTFLQHEQRRLCERINTFLGRPIVARLKFVHGSVTARPPRLRPALRVVALPSQDPALGYAGPERLKTALLALAQARRRLDGD
ncbi:MAG TPA: DciA family protein [Rhizomicrobium sp.]|nr:DciA family protein [Rhizomicrobium sp.]